MRNSAFTIVEVLSGMAIVVIVSAIAYPVMSTIQRSSHRNTCLTNFRHIGAAIVMYRENYETTGAGLPDEMGLPLHLGSLSLPLESTMCRGDKPGQGIYYVSYPTEFSGSDFRKLWLRYVQKVGPAAIIYFDPNHQNGSTLNRQWDVWTAIGLRLDGSVTVRRNFGFPLPYRWWHED